MEAANPSSVMRMTRSATAMTKNSKNRKPLSDISNLITTPNPSTHKSLSNFNTNRIAQNPNNKKSDESAFLTLYSRKPNGGKTVSKGKDVDALFGCYLQGKAKDIGKVNKADLVVLNATPVKKIKDKGKAIVVTSTDAQIEKSKDKGKAIVGNFTDHCVEKVHDRGKVIARSSISVSLERIKDKGKKTNVTPVVPSLDKTKDKGKLVAVPEVLSTLEKRRYKRKGVSVAFSCPPLLRTGHMRTELKEAGDMAISESHTDPHLKHKKKRRRFPRDQDAAEYSLPHDFIEKQRAYFKEVDEYELSEEEISDNEKVD